MIIAHLDLELHQMDIKTTFLKLWIKSEFPFIKIITIIISHLDLELHQMDIKITFKKLWIKRVCMCVCVRACACTCNWKLPKVFDQETYKRGSFKFFSNYKINIVEQTICLEQDD